MADRRMEPIAHLSINKAVKTLGFVKCPSGDNTAAIQQMRMLGQEWVDRVKSGPLSRRDVWFVVNCQVNSGRGWGLGFATLRPPGQSCATA